MFCAAVIALTLLAAPAQQIVALNAARVYVDGEADAVTASAIVPANIQLSGNYQSIVQAMLRRSATFRRQCSRIGRHAWLNVTVSPDLSTAPGGGAVTTIRRDPRGGLDAVVRLTGQGDLVELIAHEFEHILEQLDEVDLPAMAARLGTGVRVAADAGHFETDRAIAAGRAVAREVANARR
jgi:hypothetical protein